MSGAPSRYQQQVDRDVSDSAFDFARVVWPVAREWCGGGELVPVESVMEADFTRKLDRLAGIDAWQVIDGFAMRGIASRVQYGETAWASFTIREQRWTGQETELAKRLRVIEQKDRGWLYPAVTVQAYVGARRTGRLLYCCAVNTEELLLFIKRGTAGRDYIRRQNGSDGNSFIVVWVDTLRQHGIEVREYTAPGALVRRR